MSMTPELQTVIKAIRNAKHQGRHDGLGRPIIDVDFYQETALKACKQIEDLANEVRRLTHIIGVLYNSIQAAHLTATTVEDHMR